MLVAILPAAATESLGLAPGLTCVNRTALTAGGKGQESGMAGPVQLSCGRRVAGSWAPRHKALACREGQRCRATGLSPSPSLSL